MEQFSTDKNPQFKFDSGDHVFFTSDTHFNHDNIIKFCDRPFKDVAEMDEELIRRWNEKIGPDDIVFHLGDFAWGGSDVWNKVIDRLNGHIYLVLGNHDEKNLRQGYIKKFEWVGYQMHIYIEGRSVYLNHYPFLCYGGTYRNKKEAVWQLYGHVHSKDGMSGQDKDRLSYCMKGQYDVGVDNNNYVPISWEEVKQKIESQYENEQVKPNRSNVSEDELDEMAKKYAIAELGCTDDDFEDEDWTCDWNICDVMNAWEAGYKKGIEK